MREDISTAYNPKYPRTIVQFPSTDATGKADRDYNYLELSRREIARCEYYPFLESL